MLLSVGMGTYTAGASADAPPIATHFARVAVAAAVAGANALQGEIEE